MQIELINTGSELMLGFVLNSHQQWICRKMTEQGYTVTRQVAVPDTAEAIESAVAEALARVDLIITTGGLGPTSDDVTRERIASLLGLELREDEQVVREIEAFFADRGRHAPEATRVQALIPDGARILHNAKGTAPGLILRVAPGMFRGGESWLVMLPGPPRELRPMFLDQVVPWLCGKFPAPQLVCRVFKTTGMGESLVQEKIAKPLAALTEAGLEIGYCARMGEVDVRLIGRGERAGAMVEEASRIVTERLRDFIYAADSILEEVVVALLTQRRETVALAESCTGGLMAHRLTNVPGASAVFWGGFVTYSNESKQQLLGVRPATLAEHGAVSEQTAREMAEGARERAGVTYALSVTGIAGPGGGSESKPVGTVFMALAGPSGTVGVRSLNAYERETFKQVTTQQALELLRKSLVGPESGA